MVCVAFQTTVVEVCYMYTYFHISIISFFSFFSGKCFVTVWIWYRWVIGKKDFVLSIFQMLCLMSYRECKSWEGKRQIFRS